MRALVLSGGGSKGSFQAGAVGALARHPRFRDGFGYIAGASVGAINAAALAMFKQAEFKAAADWLEAMWRERLSIWRKRFPPYLAALWSSSLGTNAGLVKLLKKRLRLERVRSSDVRLSITAVNLLDGALRRFTKRNFSTEEDLHRAVLASASFPVAFPPEKIEQGWYTDGGVRDIAPLKPAIEEGASEIVIILTSHRSGVAEVSRADVATALKIALRVADIMSHEILVNDIHTCEQVNQKLAEGTLSFKTGKRPIRLCTIEPRKPLGDAATCPSATTSPQTTSRKEARFAT
jgi:NTE family protein